MNKNEKDYSQGKIYKIISDLTDMIYIGSTKRFYLNDRLSKHNWEYREWLKGRKKYVSSFEIIKLENFKIVLIENFPCNSKDELVQREQYYIDKYKSNLVNKNNSYMSIEDKKEYKRLNQLNRDKDKKQAEHKKYVENNKERVLENNNKSYHNNKYKYHINIICDCGCEIVKSNLNRHLKSKKHIKLMSEKE